MRKPEVDGDPSRLLLFEPIRIGPCERTHERTLAVIDMAGRADNDGFQRRPFLIARSFRPGTLLALAGLRRGRSPLPGGVTRSRRAGLPRSRGLMRLCRGPRLLSDARTRSRISVSPRSIWRRSMSTLTTCTETLSPSRYTLSGLLSLQDVRLLDEPVVVVGHRRDVHDALDEVFDQLDEQAECASPR